MTALAHFQHSIAAAKKLTTMYTELRRHRGLGQRGRLTPVNEDLLWLPRSAVVASLSSLDAYVHAVLQEKIPHALRSNPVPTPLCEAMATIIPIKSATNFKDMLKELPSLKNPANEQQRFQVLEVWGYIYKARYRMRLIYAPMGGSCTLMGQEVLEYAKL